MKSPSTFGDSIEVGTIAYLAETQIHIVQLIESDSYKVTQRIPFNEYTDKPPIVLLYTPPSRKVLPHYELLMKKDRANMADLWANNAESVLCTSNAATGERTISLLTVLQPQLVQTMVC